MTGCQGAVRRQVRQVRRARGAHGAPGWIAGCVVALLAPAGVLGAEAAVAAPLLAAPAAPTSPVAGGVACAVVDGFSRLSGGALYRLHDAQVLTGVNTLAEAAKVGSGWGGFAWTGMAGDGVIYALTGTGSLIWYRFDAATGAWAPGSGAVVGSGFTPGSKVLNIAVGANGWIYTVRSDGRLVLYQHTGRLTGAASWVNGSGFVLGSGWTGDEIIAPQGDGTLYRQTGGNLYWFRHTDPTAGPVTWTNAGRAVRIGVGWRFYDVLALGAGVLLTTASPSGQVSLYRHADPLHGGQGWAVTALAKYVARSDSFGVTVSPGGCS